jgi:hypothetical protein
MSSRADRPTRDRRSSSAYRSGSRDARSPSRACSCGRCVPARPCRHRRAPAADEISVRGRPRNSNIRILHSLDGSISQKLAQMVEKLGRAVRVLVVSPFWDRGLAVDDLCTGLNLPEFFVHAHLGGTVEGPTGSNWPANAASTVRPVRLDVMNEDKPRRLHAKIFEVICKRGRVFWKRERNHCGAE